MQWYDQGLGCLLWAWQWLVNGGNVVETGQASLPPLGMLAIWKTRWSSSKALFVSKERSSEEKVRWNNILYELSIVLISHFRPKVGKHFTLLITAVCSCILYNYLIDRYWRHVFQFGNLLNIVEKVTGIDYSCSDIPWAPKGWTSWLEINGNSFKLRLEM